MAEAERDDLRKEVASLRESNMLMATAIENATPPDYSADEIKAAKEVADRAIRRKEEAQSARNEARLKAEAADKARAEAEAETRHVEKHADRRVREAEKVRDDALAKADAAFARGVERGVDKMQRAFISALLMEKRGDPPGTVVVLNEEREPIDERVMDRAWSLVGELADLRDDT
jgi:hypothetical protein